MRNPISGLIHFISFLACVNLLDTHYAKNGLEVLSVGIIGNAVFVVRDWSLATPAAQTQETKEDLK